jgi:hypothetical protein
MKRIVRYILSAALAAALLLPALPVSAEPGQTGFPDVPAGAWYEQQLLEMQEKTPGLISGLDDENGVRIFNPDGYVKRGEFLRMIMAAAECYTADKSRSRIHWAGDYYTMALENNALVADVYTSSYPIFECTAEELEKPIFRYEMAVILNNVCRNIAMQKTVIVTEPETHITDYAEIPERYAASVEQTYGKGLLTGDESHSFNGWDSLTRAQAVIVLHKFLFLDTIQGVGLQDWAAYPQKDTSSSSSILAPEDSFANWLRGHLPNGKPDDEAKARLFGVYATQGYFANATQAAPYMETVSVPVWTVDRMGNKVESATSITVNKAVAQEVRAIFQMIFDDPEQFPIYGGWSAGGARYTDHLRHSWGCAIDVNALYNCECNTYSGALSVTCGYGWWPLNTAWTIYAGSLSAPSIYSIGKNEGDYGHSVVEAFAAYGWGWGGNGWSNGTKFDYMHFSILPSGG